MHPLPSDPSSAPSSDALRSRPHRASRVEDVVRGWIVRTLQRRGWTPRVLPYTGYGTGGRIRVLGRVLLCPPGARQRELEGTRGWRRFFSAAVSDVQVEVEIAGRRRTLVSARGGYLDEIVEGAAAAPGWVTATFTVGDAVSEAPIRVVTPDGCVGLLSDVDDTVMVTALPRPLVAFWNTFVRRETSRHPVPGMARLYAEVLRRHPDAPVVYLSTGAWNVAPALTVFLDRHGYPPGVLLMTDWGPTEDGWFRSGREHKRTQLRRLLADLPQVTWLLVGDDGQHDPQLYGEVADAAPARVRAVAIRQLTPSEQVLTHGTPGPLTPVTQSDGRQGSSGVVEVRAADGDGLLAALLEVGALA